MAIVMNDNRFSWCCVTLVLAMTVMSVKAQNACNTPRGESGICVPYNKCSTIKSEFERYGDSIPQSFYQEIRRRHCVQFRNEILICCENRYTESATEPATRTATRPVSQSLTVDTDDNVINQDGLKVLSSMRCGQPPDNRVSFGEPANLGQFPWMALLSYQDSPEKFLCGGSLITERYVLTAAHCIVGQPYKVTGVRLGEHDISKEMDCQPFGATQRCSPPVEDFGIEKIITHEGYKGIKNDIALIRLDRNVECKRHIQTVCLPITSKSKALQFDQEYFIAGWGKTEKDVRSNVLIKATIPHLPLSTCLKVYRTYSKEISDGHLCAGGRKRMDTCKGDSGGPLFFLSPYDMIPRFVQYGVVSHGVLACGPERNYPSLFTRVEAFLPWITKKLAEYEHVPSKLCSRA